MTQNFVNWGVLGTSMISATMARAIKTSTHGKVVAIGSRSLESAKSFAHEHDIAKYYSDFQAVLNDPDVEVVYIGLPNHLHKEWIMRAAAAGKHILCEKPFVTNARDAREAFAAVKEANVFCMEALMYRCHPFTHKLFDIIKEKIIGDISLFSAVYMADIARFANPVEGGSIMNLGCYPVSLIRLLIGCDQGKTSVLPRELKAIGRVNQQQRDNQTSVIMQFENNIMAVVNTADDSGMYFQFEIYGTKGYLRCITNPWLPEENSIIEVYKNGQSTPIEIRVTAEKPLYTYQIDAVNQHVLAGKTQSDAINWQDSLENVAVLEAWLQQVQKYAAKMECQLTT